MAKGRRRGGGGASSGSGGIAASDHSASLSSVGQVHQQHAPSLSSASQAGGNQSFNSSTSNAGGGAETASATSTPTQQQKQKRVSSNTSKSNNKSNNTTNNIPVVSRTIPVRLPSFSRMLKGFKEWVYAERQGILWVLGCIFIGGLFGFGLGSGLLTGAATTASSSSSSVAAETAAVTAWRIELGARIRSTTFYRVLTLQGIEGIYSSTSYQDPFSNGGSYTYYYDGSNELHPSHPRVFDILREAIIREDGGYVHPDLGYLVPAPCGAARGIGMVRSSYHECQIQCFPGVASEKLQEKQNIYFYNNNISTTNSNNTYLPPIPKQPIYKQEEILVRVPLSYQMTRKVALDALLPRIPNDVQRKTSIHELDDAILLVLLLAHERGVGKHSRWFPYIMSLPKEPSCGYSKEIRSYMLDAIQALKDEIGLDVNGWPGELMKASQHSIRIINSLLRDYGQYIEHPDNISPYDNLKWALCQVTSRATAGQEKHGALRLIPVIDLINHDNNAGSFVELTGKEKLENGDFVDAVEDEIDKDGTGTAIQEEEENVSGTFVVRSIRHGRRKPLKRGQELLANYNIPHYSPLDWFVSLGFVPPERWNKWSKIDSVLPKIASNNHNRRKAYYKAQQQQRQLAQEQINNNDNSNNNKNNNNSEEGHEFSQDCPASKEQQLQQQPL